MTQQTKLDILERVYGIVLVTRTIRYALKVLAFRMVGLEPQ